MSKNIIHFDAEKILHNLEKEIKSICGEGSHELEIVRTAKDILRGKIDTPFEVDRESFLRWIE